MSKQHRRKYNKIDYSKTTRQRNIKYKRGQDNQTSSLNINLKTINKAYLNMYIINNKNQQQIKIVKNYIDNMKGSFQSTRNLFGCNNGCNNTQEINHLQNRVQSQQAHNNIRMYMRGVYQSTGFVRNIFSNQKMDFKSKLIFVKFLQKIVKAAKDPENHKYWKQKI